MTRQVWNPFGAKVVLSYDGKAAGALDGAIIDGTVGAFTISYAPRQDGVTTAEVAEELGKRLRDIKDTDVLVDHHSVCPI